MIAACSSAPRAATRVEGVPFAPELGVDIAASTRTASGLYYRDLVVGTGAEATTGSQVAIVYAGALPSGVQVDATKPGDAPLSFRIERGSQRPVAGFEQGVKGMRVGGRRQVIIPPELGYGRNGYGPVPPNSVLVFTLELLSVR